jgi:hypothetical protein
MKRTLIAIAIALVAATQIGQAQTMSESSTAPVPGTYDVSQLQFHATGSTAQPAGGFPNGFNYYWDANNNNPGKPGSTFTTGSNPGGYILNSVTVNTVAGSPGGTYTTAATYTVRIYKVNSATTNATLLINYANPTPFAFSTGGDWLTMSDLSLPLSPNTTYAYTLGGSQGYCQLNYSNSLGSAGSDLSQRLVQIPIAGGRMNISTSANLPAATFDVGLSLPTALAIAPPTASAANPVNQGTTVTLTAGTVVDNVGNGTYTYQWLTDGGDNSVTLTNIPGATSSTYAFNTTGVNLGNYQFEVKVTDSTPQSITSTPLVLDVIVREAGTFGTTPASINPIPGASDAYQLASAGNGNDTGSHPQGNLNYYTDNGQNNGGWMGETFTTGSNPKGYFLNSVAVCLDGQPGPDAPSYGFGGLVATNGTYNLYIYKISADLTTAQTIGLVTNYSPGFTISNHPVWFQTSFSPITLDSNAVYGYGFGRGSVNVGYAQLALSPTANVYSGGIAASFPAGGGTVTYINNGENGVFDIGLTPLGVPFLLTAAIATPNPAYALSPVKLGCKPTTPGIFTYQWMSDDGSGNNLTPIIGATATNLTVIPPDLNPGGADYTTNYYFAARDTLSGNSVTSSVVALTVHAASAPQFTATPTPTNLVTFVGDSRTYTVTEVGTLPITNQWQFDNGGGYVSLTAKTNTTLILTGLQTTDSGNYQIAATNLLGGTNTDAVTLKVLPAPAAPTAGQKYYNMAYTNHSWAYWRLNETNDPTVLDAPTYRA